MKRPIRQMAAVLVPAVAVVAGGWSPAAHAAEMATKPATKPTSRPVTRPAAARPAAVRPAVVVDLSTPKAAAQAFATALQAGDVAGVEAAAFGTPEQVKMMQAMASLMAAFRVLADAAEERFGPDTPFKHMTQSMDVATQLDQADVTVDGDAATVTNRNPARGGAGAPMGQLKLARRDGKWRVDLGSIPMGPMDAKMLEAVPAMTAAADEIAADIRGGQFADATAALSAFGNRMAAAMGIDVPANPPPAQAVGVAEAAAEAKPDRAEPELPPAPPPPQVAK